MRAIQHKNRVSNTKGKNIHLCDTIYQKLILKGINVFLYPIQNSGKDGICDQFITYGILYESLITLIYVLHIYMYICIGIIYSTKCAYSVMPRK